MSGRGPGSNRFGTVWRDIAICQASVRKCTLGSSVSWFSGGSGDDHWAAKIDPAFMGPSAGLRSRDNSPTQASVRKAVLTPQ